MILNAAIYVDTSGKTEAEFLEGLDRELGQIRKELLLQYREESALVP